MEPEIELHLSPFLSDDTREHGTARARRIDKTLRVALISSVRGEMKQALRVIGARLCGIISVLEAVVLEETK